MWSFKSSLSLLLGTLVLFGCTPAEKEYQNPNDTTSRPNYEENAPEQVLKEKANQDLVQKLRSKIKAGQVDLYKDVFLKYKGELLQDPHTLTAEKLSQDSLKDRLNLFNTAVLLMIENKDSHLPQVLKEYEESLYSSCSDKKDLKNCLRHVLFKKDLLSAEIALYIADLKKSDGEDYFLALDVVFALKNASSEKALLKRYLKSFPAYWEAVSRGPRESLMASRVQRRQKIYQYALCVPTPGTDDVVSGDVESQLFEWIFNSEGSKVRPLSQSQIMKCSTDRLSGKFLDPSALEELKKGLAGSWSSEGVASGSQNTMNLPAYGKTVNYLKGLDFDVFKSLNFSEIKLNDLNSKEDLYFVFLMDQVFHQKMSLGIASDIYKEVFGTGNQSEAQQKRFLELLQSYLGNYLTYLSVSTHKKLGAFYANNYENGKSFLAQLNGELPKLRPGWRQTQEGAEFLYRFFEEALFNGYRTDGKSLPKALSQLEMVLIDVPQSVKLLGDIPAQISMVLMMSQREWELFYWGVHYDASLLLQNLLDGEMPSWFDFSRPSGVRLTGSRTPFTSYEVVYGFDYFFRLKLFDSYHIPIQSLFKITTEQFMKKGLSESTFRLQEKWNDFRSIIKSASFKDSFRACNLLQNGQRVPFSMLPTQIEMAVGVGTIDNVINDKFPKMLDGFMKIFVDYLQERSGGSGPGQGFRLHPHYDLSEFLRTTYTPRLQMMENIFSLYLESAKERGESVDGIQREIDSQSFSYYRNLRKSFYKVYDDYFDKSYQCAIDFSLMEKNRRAFAFEMERRYLSSLHDALSFLKHLQNSGKSSLTMAQLKLQFPNEALWKDPYLMESFSDSLMLDLASFIQQKINRPDPRSQESFPGLEQAFSGRPSLSFNGNGEIFYHYNPMRFTYRAKRYMESGFWRGQELVKVEDGLDYQDDQFPKSYAEIENNKELKALFAKEIGVFKYSESKAQFIADGMRVLSKYLWWYRSSSKNSILPLRSYARLNVSRIRAIPLETSAEDCGSESLDTCMASKRHRLIQYTLEGWMSLFKLFNQNSEERILAQINGVRTIFQDSSRRDMSSWVDTFLKESEEPLPYFDFVYDYFTSGVVTTAGSNRIRDRVSEDPSASASKSPWESDLYEMKKATEFFEEYKQDKVHFGLDENGKFRANEIFIQGLRKEISFYFQSVSELEEMALNYRSEDLPPFALFADEPPVTNLDRLNMRTLSFVAQEHKDFQCQTDNLFATETSFCPSKPRP